MEESLYKKTSRNRITNTNTKKHKSLGSRYKRQTETQIQMNANSEESKVPVKSVNGLRSHMTDLSQPTRRHATTVERCLAAVS